MAKKIRDTDFLEISARTHAMEAALLTEERIERILAAPTEEMIAGVLAECGYADLDAEDPADVEAALYRRREERLSALQFGLPDPRYLNIFRIKYDYHNVKAILKAGAVGGDPSHLLIALGRVPTETLQTAVERENTEELPGLLADAIGEAKAVLESAQDPQRSDMILDQWMYRDMMRTAEESGSRFLIGCVRVQIDAANLRILVRTMRMGKQAAFLNAALLDGGSFARERLLLAGENGGEGLRELYDRTHFAAAAEAGEAALRGGTLTAFEKACDDAVIGDLAAAQNVPFGEEVLLGYLTAGETELTNLRILLLCKAAGLPADTIRAALRKAYQ